MRAEDIPRQCVFAGTSNVVNFLPLDRSGNRRFLPIMCDVSKAEVHILEDEEASRKYIEQIYNEALKEFGKPRNSEAREIGLIMNGTISGWKAYPNPRNIPGYGKQRGWFRVETNSGNKDLGFISVEGTQMEIPFESQ